MSEYRFERLQAHHYEDLIFISQSAFKFKPRRKYYSWKNSTGKFGESNLGYIAYHSATNEPAAFYGVYSQPVKYKNKIYSAVQSGDTMTHKKHQGKGLFTQLARMTFELAAHKGAEFVYGWPNKNSYPGFINKLKWIHHNNVNNYEIKVITLPLLKLAKVFRVFNFIYSFYLKLILLFYKTDKLFEGSTESSLQPFIPHTEDFYLYKKFNRNYLIKIGTKKLWIKPDGFLYVGDIERGENDDTNVLIKRIKRFAFLIGADKVFMGFCPGTHWDERFKQVLQAQNGLAYCSLNFTNRIPSEDLKYVFADIDTF